MATVTRSIGTTPTGTTPSTTGRDYSTISAWEADLDNGAIYASGDDAVGECYNDSVFDEAVSLNGGNTIGLASVTLTGAAGERHDGTANTGVVVQDTGGASAVINIQSSVTAARVEWLDVDGGSGASNRFSGVEFGNNSGSRTVANCIVRNVHGSINGAFVAGVRPKWESDRALNCIIYDIRNTGSNGVVGVDLGSGGFVRQALNNTIDSIIAAGTDNAFGIIGGGSAQHAQNNIITRLMTGTGTSTAVGSAATQDYTATDEATIAGANSIASIVRADQYVSTTIGSEDLRLKSGSDAIDVGIDLGTTNGVNVDIAGRDRDAEGDTWDIGAHEHVAAAAGQYVPVAVDFDGTNDYLTRGGDLTGNADGKQGTVSFWLNLAGDNGAFETIIGAAGDLFNIVWTSGEVLRINGYDASVVQRLGLFSRTPLTSADGWVHVMASWDLANTVAHLYVNGVDDLAASPTLSDAHIDYTRAEWSIGADADGTHGARIAAGLADVYLNTAEYVDLSILANRTKFFDEGPVDLGSDGSAPTGSQPAVWLHNPVATWHTNDGAGGGFTLNGALTESATAPGSVVDTTLAATGVATAAASSTLTTAIQFAVAGTATAIAGAAMSSAIHLSAAAEGTAAAAADISTAIDLSTTATLTADATASLTSTITLSAAGVATAAASAGITTAIGLSATLAGNVAGAGDLSTAITLAATSVSAVTVLADMEAGTGLAAQASAAATTSAGLATAIALSAEVSASATTSATLDAGQAISGAGVATATVTADLATAIPLAAVAAATGTVAAPLTTELRLAATAAATLGVAATLSTQIPLGATVAATAVAQATLEGGVGLAAQATATVSGQAALLTGIALQATGDASVIALADLLTGLGLGDITDPGVISVTPWRDLRSITPVRATVPI